MWYLIYPALWNKEHVMHIVCTLCLVLFSLTIHAQQDCDALVRQVKKDGSYLWHTDFEQGYYIDRIQFYEVHIDSKYHYYAVLRYSTSQHEIMVELSKDDMKGFRRKQLNDSAESSYQLLIAPLLKRSPCPLKNY